MLTRRSLRASYGKGSRRSASPLRALLPLAIFMAAPSAGAQTLAQLFGSARF